MPDPRIRLEEEPGAAVLLVTDFGVAEPWDWGALEARARHLFAAAGYDPSRMVTTLSVFKLGWAVPTDA